MTQEQVINEISVEAHRMMKHQDTIIEEWKELERAVQCREIRDVEYHLGELKDAQKQFNMADYRYGILQSILQDLRKK